MLKIQKLSNFALSDISFTLLENDNLIILGENGAGKTTLAKTISGIIPSNSIKINNKLLSNIQYSKRVALVNYIPSTLDVFDEYLK